MKADAVFEGGGVKGIGLVGAIAEIEKASYVFENMAGTSAGAIVASLLAVGYTAIEIKRELELLDYNHFKDEGTLDKMRVIGKGLSIVFQYGIYEGWYFENWLEQLLQAKGKTTFGQIKRATQRRNIAINCRLLDLLFANGEIGAKEFLQTWDFAEWVKKYR